jgi:hypothetical protein
MLQSVTQKREIQPMPWWRGWLPMALLALMACGEPVWAQSVSGVRGFSGGTGALFSFAGPGNLYVDNQGNQGYIYNFGNNFESFNFRLASGQANIGGMMTLGPQLTIGLIQGANQMGSPLVFPPVPKLTAPLQPIQSSILDDFEPLIDIP